MTGFCSLNFIVYFLQMSMKRCPNQRQLKWVCWLYCIEVWNRISNNWLILGTLTPLWDDPRGTFSKHIISCQIMWILMFRVSSRNLKEFLLLRLWGKGCLSVIRSATSPEKFMLRMTLMSLVTWSWYCRFWAQGAAPKVLFNHRLLKPTRRLRSAHLLRPNILIILRQSIFHLRLLWF